MLHGVYCNNRNVHVYFLFKKKNQRKEKWPKQLVYLIIKTWCRVTCTSFVPLHYSIIIKSTSQKKQADKAVFAITVIHMILWEKYKGHITWHTCETSRSIHTNYKTNKIWFPQWRIFNSDKYHVVPAHSVRHFALVLCIFQVFESP